MQQFNSYGLKVMLAYTSVLILPNYCTVSAYNFSNIHVTRDIKKFALKYQNFLTVKKKYSRCPMRLYIHYIIDNISKIYSEEIHLVNSILELKTRNV